MKQNYLHEKKAHLPFVLALGLLVAPLPALAETEAPHADAVAAVNQQKVTISGIVKDAAGEPIIGASVIEKGNSLNGVITDVDGRFTLSLSGKAIDISYVGYKTETIQIKPGVRDYNVLLHEDTEMIDEVVVVGYGVQKKSNLTGSVSSVDSKVLDTRPVSSVSAALAGQMPGVTAIQSSGAPGSQTSSITIRGKNSINAASPLVIVDGVPGSMNTIDPADIESLTVLKDAASAAIYGVQAANGVILITTKQGKKGDKARISYSGTFSWASPVAKRDYVNAYEFATLYNEATYNENPDAPMPFSDEEIEAYRTGALPSTDWYDAAFKKTAFEQMHNISISGGSEKTNYNGSLGIYPTEWFDG